MFKKFRDFAFKGNVIDMAVGIIVGGAFSTIVSSLVNDIMMPFFGFLTADVDFKELKFVLSQAVVENGTVVKPETAVTYGNFIQNVVNFLIISLSIYMMVGFIGKARQKLLPEEETTVETPAAPTQEELLAEIRDLLKESHTALPPSVNNDTETIPDKNL